MAVLIKVPRQDFGVTIGSFDVPKTTLGIAGSGERAFVWFAETQGGRGLAACGVVEALTPNADGTIRISLREIAAVTARFGNAQLSPWRNSLDQRPESTLAKKLFRYSHNRAVRLTNEEEEFLSSIVG